MTLSGSCLTLTFEQACFLHSASIDALDADLIEMVRHTAKH